MSSVSRKFFPQDFFCQKDRTKAELSQSMDRDLTRQTLNDVYRPAHWRYVKAEPVRIFNWSEIPVVDDLTLQSWNAALQPTMSLKLK
jgi:hypothetical protein